MKKLMKLAVLVIIMVLGVVTLTGCSINVGETEKNDMEGLPVYTVDADMTGYIKFEGIEGVEFYYPSNYKSVGTETQPIYMDPDIAGASVNIISDDFSSMFSFEGYIEASIIGIKQQMTIIGDVKTEYINLNGNKAGKLDYVATTSGQTMAITQVIIVKDSKVYALTLGSLQKDAEEFKPKMEKIIKSFK